MVRHLWSTLSLLIGVLVAALGLASFLLPNHFIDGGVTGVSMLLARLSGIPLPVLLIVVNAPFVLVAYGHVGRVFAVKSSLAIIGSSEGFAILFKDATAAAQSARAAFGSPPVWVVSEARWTSSRDRSRAHSGRSVSLASQVIAWL